MEILEKRNLTHRQSEISLQAALENLIAKVKARGDLPYISVEKQIELIDQLSQFDLGRFFIMANGGLNGYWTHYIVTHPLKGRLTGLNNRGEKFSSLETFILDKAPYALATQQRFEIFKKEIQKRAYEGCALASIPCGLMGDLLELDFSPLTHFTLHGIDLDPDSLFAAKMLAEKKGLSHHCQFLQEDAWDLKIQEQFTLIASNGLAFYEPDDKKVIELYRKFHQALKKEGWLVISFLTPPPLPGMTTEWDLSKINQQDALLQKVIFADLFESKWQVFRSLEKVKNQLNEAGFEVVDVFYDDAHTFPTILAKKIKKIYRAQEGFVNLDSARRSKIEAKRSDRRNPAPSGQSEEEDRFGKDTASPNSQNLTERGIKAVIFDCDGTLIDSEYSHYLSWQHALQKQGHDLSLEEYYPIVGKSAAENSKLLAEKTGRDCASELLKDKRTYYHQLQLVGIPPLQHAINFVRLLAEKKKECRKEKRIRDLLRTRFSCKKRRYLM